MCGAVRISHSHCRFVAGTLLARAQPKNTHIQSDNTKDARKAFRACRFVLGQANRVDDCVCIGPGLRNNTHTKKGRVCIFKCSALGNESEQTNRMPDAAQIRI